MKVLLEYPTEACPKTIFPSFHIQSFGIKLISVCLNFSSIAHYINSSSISRLLLWLSFSARGYLPQPKRLWKAVLRSKMALLASQVQSRYNLLFRLRFFVVDFTCFISWLRY